MTKKKPLVPRLKEFNLNSIRRRRQLFSDLSEFWTARRWSITPRTFAQIANDSPQVRQMIRVWGECSSDEFRNSLQKILDELAHPTTKGVDHLSSMSIFLKGLPPEILEILQKSIPVLSSALQRYVPVLSLADVYSHTTRLWLDEKKSLTEKLVKLGIAITPFYLEMASLVVMTTSFAAFAPFFLAGAMFVQAVKQGIVLSEGISEIYKIKKALKKNSPDQKFEQRAKLQKRLKTKTFECLMNAAVLTSFLLIGTGFILTAAGVPAGTPLIGAGGALLLVSFLANTCFRGYTYWKQKSQQPLEGKNKKQEARAENNRIRRMSMR